MSSFYTNFFSIGNKLYVRRIDNGVSSNHVVEFGANLYVRSDEEPDSYSIYDEPLKKMEFSSPKEAKDFVKMYQGQTVYGYNRFEYLAINELFPGEMEFDYNKIVIGNLDIETTVESGFPDINNPVEEILLITIFFGKKRFTLTCKDPGEITDSKVLMFQDEAKMLRGFVELMQHYEPHVLTGWNIKYFDIPYLLSRISFVLGKNFASKLSPFGIVSWDETNYNGRTQYEGDIRGVSILDYLELYQKFELSPRESYKLDNIADVELGENKLEYEGTFKEFYTKDFHKFVKYNIRDVELVERLDDKLKFLMLAMTIGYTAKCNYDDVYRVTRIWDNMIALHLLSENMQVEFNPSHSGDGFEGAFVKPTRPGFYKWLGSFDLESLYPSIIIQQNISPEVMLDPREFIPLTPHDVNTNSELYKRAIERAKELNATLCANGAMFSKEKQGFIAKLTDQVFQGRKSAKKEMKDWSRKLELAKAELARRTQ